MSRDIMKTKIVAFCKVLRTGPSTKEAKCVLIK
jgi:hypothetical protein